uniref:nesprin-2 n=1 Tax=Maylandia zebra TaxID=106582 RepID=UPI0006CED57B|nr:nesprin-2 [Maylandia zebra]
MVKLRRRTTGEMWEVVTVQSPNETSILTSPTQDFHESLHSLLLWLAHAESGRYAVDIGHPDTTLTALQQHSNTLTALQKELQDRQAHQASLQTLWSQLQPEDGTEESNEAREKLHVTGSKLKLLLKQVDGDLSNLRQRLDCESATAAQCQSVSQEAANSKKGSSTQREKRESSPPRSFFYRALRAAFPLQLLLLLLLLLPCLIPMSESDSTLTNNFARSFYPMLHYPNGPLDCNIPQGSILAICPAESDIESVLESGPDSDTDHSDTDDDTDNNNSDNNDTDENDNDDGGDNVQDGPVPLASSPVLGGSRRRPREEEDDEKEDGAPGHLAN